LGSEHTAKSNQAYVLYLYINPIRNSQLSTQMKINLAGNTIQDLKDALTLIDHDVIVNASHIEVYEENHIRYLDIHSELHGNKLDDMIAQIQDQLSNLSTYNGKHIY
jgi:hypothetical protein